MIHNISLSVRTFPGESSPPLSGNCPEGTALYSTEPLGVTVCGMASNCRRTANQSHRFRA
jgi:hypothetical protein